MDQDIDGGGVRIEGGVGSAPIDAYGGGRGGDVQITGGPSKGKHLVNDAAGQVLLDGGESRGNGYGGAIRLRSGKGPISGLLHLETRGGEDNMRQGSGLIQINTGQVEAAKSGDLSLFTGSATRDNGQAGTIKIESGASGSEHMMPRNYHPYSFNHRDPNEGGALVLEAGKSYDGIGGRVDIAAGGGSVRGGDFNLTAGTGLDDSSGGDGLISGGSSITNGGSVSVQGGTGGQSGGDVHLLGGETSGNGSPGGDVKIESGRSSRSGSGSVVITSSESSSAPSGDTTLTSGATSTRYVSGNVRVTSGESASRSGAVEISSATSPSSGKVQISSGDATSEQSGDVELSSGQTLGMRASKETGKISLATSSNTNGGNSGDIKLATGDSMSGSSGNVEIEAVSVMFS